MYLVIEFFKNSNQLSLSTGIKRAASTSSTLKKNAMLPKSESASGLPKSDLIGRLLEKQVAEKSHTVNYAKMKTTGAKIRESIVSGSTLKPIVNADNNKENNNKSSSGAYANVSKYKNYSELFETNSDCSTIGDIKQNVLCKKLADLGRRNMLNVPKNMSKSIDSVLSNVNAGDEILAKASK